jgi:transcriptional regulator with XRE-family HTH domain
LIEINTLTEENNMKYISKDTKTFKVFTALRAGEKLTQSEAAKRFGVKNLSAEASRIRSHGYAVYSNSRKAGNGVTVTEYELGNPSREIVALGYRAKALGISL